MYVAVKGGERAIDNAHALLAHAAARRPGSPGASRRADRRAARARRRPRDGRGLALRPRARRARHQAGARRPDRGDLPACAPSAPRCRASARPQPLDTGAMHGRAAHLGDLQGPARRPGARPDLRLHAPPARLRAGRRRARRRAAPCASRRGDRRAARHRPARRRGPDRAQPRRARTTRPVGDLTREPLAFPAGRDLRLQNLARGDEGFLLALGYSTQRGYGRTHPFVGEIRLGEVEVEFFAEELGLRRRRSARSRVTECQMVNQFARHGDRAAAVHPRLRARLRAVRAQGDVDGAGRPRAARARVRRGRRRAGPGRGIRAVALRQRAGDRLRRAPEAAALRRLPGRARPGAPAARRVRGAQRPKRRAADRGGAPNDRRRLQLRLSRRADQADDPPRASSRRSPSPATRCRSPRREMPMPYGWGTGGVQVTAAMHRRRRRAQGHRPGRRRHHQRRVDPQLLRQDRRRRTTTATAEATIIQTRHRIPETPLRRGPDPGLPGADPRAAALPRAARDRDAQACTRSRNTGSCT